MGWSNRLNPAQTTLQLPEWAILLSQFMTLTFDVTISSYYQRYTFEKWVIYIDVSHSEISSKKWDRSRINCEAIYCARIKNSLKNFGIFFVFKTNFLFFKSAIWLTIFLPYFITLIWYKIGLNFNPWRFF